MLFWDRSGNCLPREPEVSRAYRLLLSFSLVRLPTKISLTLSSGTHLRGDMLLTYSCKKLLRCQAPSFHFLPPAPYVLPKGNWKPHDVLLPALISESRSLTQAPEAWREVSHSLKEFVSSMSPPKWVPELNVSEISVEV